MQANLKEVNQKQESSQINNVRDDKKGKVNKKTVIVIVLLVSILFAGIGLIVGLLLQQKSSKTSSGNEEVRVSTKELSKKDNNNDLISDDSINTKVDQPGNGIGDGFGSKGNANSDVVWNDKPKEVGDIGLFSLLDTFFPYRAYYIEDNRTKLSYFETKYGSNVKYYSVGKVIEGKYKDGEVYLVIASKLPVAHVLKGDVLKDDFVYDGKISIVFVRMPSGEFIIAQDFYASNLLCGIGSWPCDNETLVISEFNKASGGKVTYDMSLHLEKYTKRADKYVDETSGYIFVVDGDHSNEIYDDSGMVLVKAFADGYRLYSEQRIDNNNLKFKSTINPTLILRYPSGLYVAVEPELQNFVYLNGVDKGKIVTPSNARSDVTFLSWVSKDTPPALDKTLKKDWTLYVMEDALAVTDVVNYTSDFSGCTVSDGDFTQSWDVQTFNPNGSNVIAKTSLGDTFYEVTNSEILSGFWKMKGRDVVPVYSDFLKYKPVIMRKNSLGIYILLFRSDFVMSSCWAEPVIYLYPESKTRVSVKLDTNIGITSTYPQYNDEWNVLAYPDGSIYTQEGGRKYPYLFWEGNAPLPEKPVVQAFLSKDNVHSYFEDVLPKLGLNNVEKQDFERYWEEKLSNNPYYLIKFYSTDSINKVVPLHVTPEPETVIRILLTYEKYNKDISFKVPNIEIDKSSVLERNGFTLIEWGGVIHKEDF